MRFANERHHVVLAVRSHVDVANDDRAVVGARLVEGLREHRGRILLVAGEELAVGAEHPVGCLDEPLSLGVLADPLQQRTDRGDGLVA